MVRLKMLRMPFHCWGSFTYGWTQLTRDEERNTQVCGIVCVLPLERQRDGCPEKHHCHLDTPVTTTHISIQALECPRFV